MKPDEQLRKEIIEKWLIENSTLPALVNASIKKGRQDERKRILRELRKQNYINENHLQSGEVEFSYTGELIPVEIVEAIINKQEIKRGE